MPLEGAPGSYESEGGERISRGSVTLPSGATWFAKLVVPVNAEESALLTVRRDATGPSLLPDEASLVVPGGEADALLLLLQGLFEQARREGLITPPESTE